MISRATVYEKLEAMKAAWYEKQGAARDVLVVGDMEDPHPNAGEVRIRVSFSGVNPGDVKKTRGRVQHRDVVPACHSAQRWLRHC